MPPADGAAVAVGRVAAGQPVPAGADDDVDVRAGHLRPEQPRRRAVVPGAPRPARRAVMAGPSDGGAPLFRDAFVHDLRENRTARRSPGTIAMTRCTHSCMSRNSSYRQFK